VLAALLSVVGRPVSDPTETEKEAFLDALFDNLLDYGNIDDDVPDLFAFGHLADGFPHDD
jgi:hypothetical protein